MGRGDDVEELDVDLDDLDDDAGRDNDSHAPLEDPPPADGRRRRRRLLAAAAAVAVVVGVALVRQAAAREEQGPPLDGSASAAELYPLLGPAGAAVGAGTWWPAAQAEAGLGVDPATAHLLAAAGGLLFWVAQDPAGQVCLVVRTSELPLRLDGACSPAAAAAARGVSLPDGSGVTATLVPVGFDTAPLREQGYAELAGGLWVDDQTAQDVAAAVVGAVTARPVVPTQAQAGDGRLPVFLTERAGVYAVVLACVGQPEAAPGRGTGGGLAADGTVELSVDGAAERVDCSTTPAFRIFSGDGGPVRVGVDVPDGVRWASRVVQCEGSLRGPVCDLGAI